MHKLHASPNSVCFFIPKKWFNEVPRRKRAKSAPSTTPSVGTSSGSKPSKFGRAYTLGGGLDKKSMGYDWRAQCFNATVKCRHRTMKEGVATEEAGEALVQADRVKLQIGS